MGGGREWLVSPFRRQELWKCIGWVLSEVTHGNRGHTIWSEIPKYFGNKAPTKLQRYVFGKTNLYKVCCDLYRTFYIHVCHLIISSYTTSFISWILLWVLTYLYTLHICGISLTRFKKFRTFWPCPSVDPSVKGTDNFWKVHGIIDRFNESRRQIASGV